MYQSPFFSFWWIEFAGKFFDPLRVIKNSQLLIYLKLVNKLNCMASSVRVILGDPAAACR